MSLLNKLMSNIGDCKEFLRQQLVFAKEREREGEESIYVNNHMCTTIVVILVAFIPTGGMIFPYCYSKYYSVIVWCGSCN